MIRFGCVLFCLAVPAVALAAPVTLSVQGQLRNIANGAVVDGKYTLEISLYDAFESKEPLYTDFNSGVVVTDGTFSVVMGSKIPIPAGVFNGEPRWLGVAVEGEAELERRLLRPVPYAVHSANAGSLACSGCITEAHLAPGVLAEFTKTLDLHLVATSGKYADLEGIPAPADLTPFAKSADLHGVATSGKYADLEGTPAPVDLAPFAKLAGDNVFTGANTFAAIGGGKTPAAGCSVDVKDSGLCVDGAPALTVRLAANVQGMDALKSPGQIVYRTDEEHPYIFAKNEWRKLAFLTVCGDKKVEFPEECDDGNNSNTDSCVGCKLAGCGDGVVQSGVESCDTTNLAGETCASQLGGGATGKITCSTDCKSFNTTECSVPLTKVVLAALNNAHNGNLGGIVGADLLCNTEAKAAGRPEKFKAWLSGSSQDLVDLITGSNATVPVVNIKGEQMFTNWADIFDGNSNKGASLYAFKGHLVDEGQGANPDWADADGWHGSTPSGTKINHCNNWTTAGGAKGQATEWDGSQALLQEVHACTDLLAVTCVSVSQ